MSGLCGWIGATQTVADPGQAIDRMGSLLPSYNGELSRSIIGSRFALSLRSQTKTGHWYTDGKISIALEGYPTWHDAARRTVARERGHAYAVAMAYRERGEGLLDELFGSFVVAILDPDKDAALLAIDRFGIQSLCYATSAKGDLVFGSTTDSVRAHPLVECTIPPQSIFNYLYFVDRIPAPETIYREQHKMVPGQYLSYADGRWQTKPYWQIRYAEGSGRKFDELSAELLERLCEAVSSCVEGEDLSKVATFLSGGLDSSTVSGVLAGMTPNRIKTFTIGFPIDGYDETDYAASAARHFGAEHCVYYVTAQDEFDALPRIAESYDEPYANSSAIAAYFCALRAREGGTELMLAGDGGDELFAGNSRYLADNVFDHYALIPPLLRRRLIEPILRQMASPQRTRLIRKANNYVRYASMSVPQRMTYHNVYSLLDPAEMFTAEALAEVDKCAPLALATEIYMSSTSQSKLQRMMHLDLRLTLADSDLRKVGRMCELAGVRVKYPFLDDKLAQFAASVPASMLNHRGELRYFYKHALRQFLPRKVLEKNKHGFGIPCLEFVDTYEPLQELASDCLESLKADRFFRSDFLDTLICHTRNSDTSCFNGVIWDLMCLALWLRSRSLLP